MSDLPNRCVLDHRGFPVLGDVVFQRSGTDGTPVAVVPLGEHPVSIPLRALQRELGIDDDSDDGRMLALIVESLDYVVSLQQGDPLPAEVLTGEASWEPAPHHVAAARQRLRGCVLRWTAAADRPNDMEAAVAALARLLDLPDAAAARARIESLAVELSYIEASREVLLARVRRMAARLERLRLDSAPGVQRDDLTQSRRMATVALERIGSRFTDVESKVADIVVALRRGEGLRTYLRSHRDWLHRSRMAWSPVLDGWEKEPGMQAPARRALISLTYQFLAQRFMSVYDMRSAEARRTTLRAEAVFEW